MKKLRAYLDVFVLNGFNTSFFYGFLNPLYISVILSHLDGRIIALGCLMSSAFPVLIGGVLGDRRLFERLYAILPAVMLAELVGAVGTALLAAVDLVAYYLVSMFIFGLFSTSVVYLLQKMKEVRYRNRRAVFDRRCEIADALGMLLGSGLGIVGFAALRDPLAVAGLGAAQTVIVYGVFLMLYRKMPRRKKRSAEEEPHPWLFVKSPAVEARAA